ncbi:poly-gamma-glutamate synthesis protein (capsule biosynthesis protein) [Paenibacillus wynnii]|nr:poly-gamma-glutamate synthesis protein (capsule biosynthesis protein) [Paenibacillus wynnii]
MIIAILTYVLNEDGNKSSNTPSLAVQSSASPSPDPSEAPPAVTASTTPEPTQASVEPTSTGELEPVETPDADTVVNTPSPPAPTDDGAISGLPEDTDSEGDTVKLSFGGDVIFSGKVGELLEKTGYEYPYARLGGLFKEDDLSIVNLETPVSDGVTSAANKQYVFKAPPKALDKLKAAGIDAVNLANNHTLDQGEQGLRETLSNLEERGIPYVGAGLNEESAYSAQYFERKGITVALLGFSRVLPESSWKAERNKPGLASVYESEEGLKAITEAKKKADIVIVVVHWGKERVSQADTVQQSLGRSFIDAGADLVIGGHPHVLQGIEPYKGKWIAYSTGNFIFTRSSVPSTWDTAVFQAECNVEGQCSMQLKPFNAELAQPVPMSPEDGQKLFKKVESISWGQIKIDNEGKVVHSSE